MKNLIKTLFAKITYTTVLLIFICLLYLGLTGFIIHSYEAQKNEALVSKEEGICIFTDSKPTHETDYLGTVKIGFTMGSGSYKDIISKLIKKARKEYPSAEGIIFDGVDKADVIKFK
jgi:hypothetical protein